MQRINRVIVGTLMAAIAAGPLRTSAQEPAGATAAKTFDVVSVRRNTSGTTRSNVDRTPTGVTIVNLPLRPIIQLAYGISQPVRLIGLPDWVNVDRFDLTARGSIGNLNDFRVMMQAMLADRFKLAAHTEQRSLPSFTLVMARSDGRLGPELKVSKCMPVTLAQLSGRGAAPAAAPAPDALPPPECGLLGSGPGEIRIAGVNLQTVAGFLSLTQGRPITDNTNLTGIYDLHIQFAPDPLPGQPVNPATEGRPSLLTALQEQLGLKLQPSTQLQEVLVIERVEHPDEN
jgi:uncharacterized protein (TIGR03435 family)